MANLGWKGPRLQQRQSMSNHGEHMQKIRRCRQCGAVVAHGKLCDKCRDSNRGKQ